MNLFRFRFVFAGLLISLAAMPQASAALLLQYELAGKAGTETSDPSTFAASGLTGVDLTRGSGLTGSVGSNSFSATGWNDLSTNDFFSFGFNVQAGSTATINELLFATRSSATGPGTMNVLYSQNGGPEVLIAALTQPSNTFVNSDLIFSPIVVTSSFRVILRAANGTAANGSPIASTGAFRIGDYSPDAGVSFQPITVNGSIVAVPEPASTVLFGVGLAIVSAGLARRRGFSSLAA